MVQQQLRTAIEIKLLKVTWYSSTFAPQLNKVTYVTWYSSSFTHLIIETCQNLLFSLILTGQILVFCATALLLGTKSLDVGDTRA